VALSSCIQLHNVCARPSNQQGSLAAYPQFLAAYEMHCDGYGGLVTAQILYIARCCLSLPALHELVSSAHALALIRQVL
jgi:hypothetical protein